MHTFRTGAKLLETGEALQSEAQQVEFRKEGKEKKIIS